MRIARNGQFMHIKKYNGCDDLTVEFEDGTEVNGIAYGCFKEGAVDNPHVRRVKREDVESRLGKRRRANNGQIMQIVEYRGSKDIDVEFEDGTIIKNVDYNRFLKGKLRNPNYSPYEDKHLGETNTAKCGLKMKIVKYNNYYDIDVEFEDGYKVEHTQYPNFREGLISHPAHGYGAFKTKRVGEKALAKNGMIMEIIEYANSQSMKVQFEDGAIKDGVAYGNFKKGLVGHPAKNKKS